VGNKVFNKGEGDYQIELERAVLLWNKNEK